MALIIEEGSFYTANSLGELFSGYKANAGDKTTTSFIVQESIHFLSSNTRTITSSVTLISEKKLRFPDFESMNGFAVGQSVTLTKTKPNATTVTKNTTIAGIDYENLTIEFASLLTPANENINLYDDVTTMRVYATSTRNDLYFSLNFNKSSSTPQFNSNFSTEKDGYLNKVSPYRNSLVDGSTTRFYGVGLGSKIVGSVTSLTPIGNRSGLFDSTVTFERYADLNSYTRRWQVTIVTDTHIGAFTEFPFNSIDSTSIFLSFDMEWYSVSPNLNPTVYQWNLASYSNTAWFNKPYQDGDYDSTLVSVSDVQLLYDGEVEVTAVFDSASLLIGVGGLYLPKEESYYKNNEYSLSQLTMIIPITSSLAVGTFASYQNPDGAEWELEITAYTYIGTTHTVTFIVRSLPLFESFMESRADEDREFVIFFRVGSINHLLSFGNMIATPKPTENIFPDYVSSPGTGIVLTTDDYALNYAVEDISTDYLPVNIEDNILFRARLNLPNNVKLLNVKLEVIVAESLDLNNFFILQDFSTDFNDYNLGQMIFPIKIIQDSGMGSSFSSLIENAGMEGEDEAIFKKIIIGKINTPIPLDPDQHYIQINYPFFINWKYWESQINAFIEFQPDLATKNWINYNDATFSVFLKTTIELSDKLLVHHVLLDKIYDYDETHTDPKSEWNGTTDLKYYLEDSGDEVGGLISNSLVILEFIVDNTITLTDEWLFFGQLTIEEQETSNRWSCSTNYDMDSSDSNPFQPLDGETRLLKTVTGATQSTYKAVVDTSKLSGKNYKITGKFHYFPEPIEQVRSVFYSVIDDVKYFQVIEEEEFTECCDFFKVFASSDLDNTDPKLNNISSAWQGFSQGSTLVFELYKDGVLSSWQPNTVTFPFQSNAKYCKVKWKDVLIEDGIGCYEIIASITAPSSNYSITFGKYELFEYSEERCRGLVSIRSLFDLNQQIEGINFRKSNIIDTINIEGVFGFRDPKTETVTYVNGVYENNVVVNENLNEYTLKVNPCTEYFTKKLVDLHFLSASKMQISDFNRNHNNYSLKDVVFKSIDTPNYWENSIKAGLSATFTDRKVNNRTY